MIGRPAILAMGVLAVIGQLASGVFATPLQIGLPPRTLLPKLLLWNASASAPRGLYLLHPAQPLRIGALVAARPPAPLAHFAALRGYLPLGVPLLKHVAALDGQTVCRFAQRVTIDGHVVAIAHKRDSGGRLLLSRQGCRTLRASEVFLLNATIPDLFDGRYFGVLSADAITAAPNPVDHAGPLNHAARMFQYRSRSALYRVRPRSFPAVRPSPSGLLSAAGSQDICQASALGSCSRCRFIAAVLARQPLCAPIAAPDPYAASSLKPHTALAFRRLGCVRSYRSRVLAIRRPCHPKAPWASCN